MRELVTIQLGQCGNRCGYDFWQAILQDHSIDSTGQFYGSENVQLQYANVNFSENSKQAYIPRNILFDLESSTLDQIMSSELGGLFKMENYVFGQEGAGNIWAKGMYTLGPQIGQIVLDLVRKELEECDQVQGFQIIHSIGGGTGSGFMGYLLSQLNELYPDILKCNYTIFPSQKTSANCVEPYNAGFSIAHLIENSQMTYVMDNGALNEICTKKLLIEKPTFSDLNYICSQALTAITSNLRFPGLLTCDLRKQATNLIPFPRLHFLSCNVLPLVSKECEEYQNESISELLNNIFDKRSMLCDFSYKEGRFLTGCLNFRGKLSTYEVESATLNLQNRNSSYFSE